MGKKEFTKIVAPMKTNSSVREGSFFGGERGWGWGGLKVRMMIKHHFILSLGPARVAQHGHLDHTDVQLLHPRV